MLTCELKFAIKNTHHGENKWRNSQEGCLVVSSSNTWTVLQSNTKSLHPCLNCAIMDAHNYCSPKVFYPVRNWADYRTFRLWIRFSLHLNASAWVNSSNNLNLGETVSGDIQQRSAPCFYWGLAAKKKNQTMNHHQSWYAEMFHVLMFFHHFWFWDSVEFLLVNFGVMAILYPYQCLFACVFEPYFLHQARPTLNTKVRMFLHGSQETLSRKHIELILSNSRPMGLKVPRKGWELNRVTHLAKRSWHCHGRNHECTVHWVHSSIGSLIYIYLRFLLKRKCQLSWVGQTTRIDMKTCWPNTIDLSTPTPSGCWVHSPRHKKFQAISIVKFHKYAIFNIQLMHHIPRFIYIYIHIHINTWQRPR